VGRARESLAAERIEEAVESFDRALALWSGTPLAGARGPFAEIERARLIEEYWSAVEDRAGALLVSGRDGEVAADLAGRVHDQPLRERLRGLLMLALYRSGRQADALAVFRDVRRVLVEELGVEPGPDLQRLHQQILAADAMLKPAATGRTLRAAGGVPAVRVTPAQLPHDIGGFTGRAAELARLAAWASASGAPGGGSPPPVVICAIDGTAGVGKTALAVHLAHRVASSFPDGQLFVDLRGCAPHASAMTAAEALGHLLRGLGADPRGIPADADDQAGMYRSMLAGRRVLIVLDNADSAEQVRPLLPGAGRSLVIVTSRNRLDGLIARDGARRIALDVLAPDEATAMLAHFGNAAQVAAEPDPAAMLARLCGYLPLALRIVAERAAVRRDGTLADLAADLAAEHQRLDLLTVADDAMSVRAAFCWSYHALPPAAARAFRLLGVHPGADITVPAAVALLDTTPSAGGALLGELARRHLIEETAPGRYQFHDLIRVYAAEQAAGQPRRQRADAACRLVSWYLHTADAADAVVDPRRPRVPLRPLPATLQPLWFGSYAEALHWCDAERENLLALTRHAADSGWLTEAWQLPVAVFGYFYLRKPWAIWLTATQIGLAAARRSGDRIGEAATLLSLGIAHSELRQSQTAIEELTQALPLMRSLRHRGGEAITLLTLGGAYRDLNQHEPAVQHLNEALAIWRADADRWGEAIALQYLGETRLGMRQLGQAITDLQQALRIRHDIGDQYGAAWTIHDLAYTYRLAGDYATAVDHLRHALAIRRDIGDRWGEAHTLGQLGETLLAAGCPDEARRAWLAARTIFHEIGDLRAFDYPCDLDDAPGVSEPGLKELTGAVAGDLQEICLREEIPGLTEVG
jgi:tetratricopeptide (TPR) repeat protein